MGTSLDMASQPQEQLEMTMLLHRVRHLSVLMAPVVRTCVVIDKIRRWESSMVCLLLLLLCNGSCLLFPAGYTMVLALTLVGFAGILGFTHRKTRVLTKVLPSHETRHEDLSPPAGSPTNHSELLEQYKAMLFQVNDTVMKCNEALTRFYSIIQWENLQISVRFYTLLGVLIFCLHVLPLRWSVVMAINLFLLENQVAAFVIHSCLLKACLQRIASVFRKKDEAAADKGETTSLSAASLSAASSETDLSTGKDSGCLPGSEPYFQPDQADSDTDASQKLEDCSSSGGDSEGEDLLNSEGQEVKARSGVVGRILEFKKKHQNAASGSCTGCGVNFSAILKRRHVCNYCGNHFCARCCGHKVPKSLLGATAPGSNTDTVPVCTHCHGYLTGKKDKTT